MNFVILIYFVEPSSVTHKVSFCSKLAFVGMKLTKFEDPIYFDAKWNAHLIKTVRSI